MRNFLFRHFQWFSEKYWKNLHGISLFWWIAILAIFFIYYFLPNIFCLDPEGTRSYGNILGIFATLNSFLALAVAFIGSLSIQYSLTKILLRYKYIQLFLLITGLIILKYIWGFLPEGWWNPFDIALFFDSALLVTVFFLFIHTFMLVDKVFDPEELMIDVIGDQILLFELRKIDSKKNKEKVSGILNILENFQKHRRLYILNKALPYVLDQHPEAQSYMKAIRRLVESGNQRIIYLFTYLYAKYITQELGPNYCFKMFKKKLKNKYKIEINEDVYAWFLLTIIVQQIYDLAKDEKKYDQLFSSLLITIVAIVLDDKENYFPEGIKENSSTSDDLEHDLLRIRGLIIEGGYLKMFYVLREKEMLLDFLGEKYKGKEGRHTLVRSAKKQIEITLERLIRDYVKENHKIVIDGQYREQKPKEYQIRNLLGLIELLNIVFEEKINEESVDIDIIKRLLMHQLALLPLVQKYILGKGIFGPEVDAALEMESINNYMKFLFNTQIKDISYKVFEEFAEKKGEFITPEYGDAISKMIKRGDINREMKVLGMSEILEKIKKLF